MKLYNSEEIPIPKYGEVFLFRDKSSGLLYYKKNSGQVDKLQFHEGVYLIPDKTITHIVNYTDEIVDSTFFTNGIIIRFMSIPNIVVGGGGGGSRGAQGSSGAQGAQGASGAQGAQGASAVPVVTDATLTGDGSGGSPLGLPYKVYTAFLQQDGVAGHVPTAEIYANTLGAIVYSYNSPGNYNGALAGAFTANKTWIDVAQDLDSPTGVYRVDANTINIISNNNADATVDGVLFNAIEIRVYP